MDLAQDRPRWLAFVRRRVESDEAAEEIVQAATAKALARGLGRRSASPPGSTASSATG